MKNLICIVLILFGTSCIVAGQTEVPATVTDGFAKKFTGVSKVKWEKETENEYEVSFKQNGKSMTACFDDKGNWLETEWEIRVKDLPKEVTDAVYQQYPCFEIEYAEYCESPGFTGYEMEIEKCKRKAEEEKELRVSKDGLSIEEITEESDD